MKKLALGFIIFASVCSTMARANSLEINTVPSWNGFYLGANVGYWWSQGSNTINTTGNASFVNAIDPVGGTAIANALATVGTNHVSIHGNGLIGGGQMGMNFYVYPNFLAGIDVDLDGFSQSEGSVTVHKAVSLVGYPEYYGTTLTVTKRINYMGTVRGRIGYLAAPCLMVYGVGGFAYGNVKFEESYWAQESLGNFTYPPIFVNHHPNKNLTGWTAGVGVEYMFMPHWSANIEYDYFDLGTVKKNYTLTQVNDLEIPAVAWGSANVHSSTRFAGNSIRLGINYHYC